MRGVVLTLLGVLFCAPALGAPSTYACSLLDSSQEGGDFLRLDQLEIDEDAKTIVFKAANTIGTSNPVELDLTAAIGEGPASQIIMKASERSIRAVGFLGNAGYQFFMDKSGPSQATVSLEMFQNHLLWLCSK